MQEFSYQIETDEPDAAGFIALNSGLSKTRVKDMMNKGAVWLERKGQTRRLRRARSSLQKGDGLRIYYSEQILESDPPEPQMIEDRKDYSVWYKPPGLLSSGSRFGDHCAINRWVETHFKPQRPVFIVHRLDSQASGLMILAHSKKTAAALSRQFQDRSVTKYYAVEVAGHYQGPSRIDTPLDGKDAISHIELLETLADKSRLKVRIETGRKHQIRRHLAEAGHPVIGDRLYGGPASDHIHLNAYYLAITCPVSGILKKWILDGKEI